MNWMQFYANLWEDSFDRLENLLKRMDQLTLKTLTTLWWANGSCRIPPRNFGGR